MCIIDFVFFKFWREALILPLLFFNRPCDHSTSQILVTTPCGGHRLQRVRTDAQITVYCGQGNAANKQGGVFVFVESTGEWRGMQDEERRDANGKGVELYSWPYTIPNEFSSKVSAYLGR